MDSELTTTYELSKEGLANAIAILLSSTVVAEYMAHGFHWNVKGPEFTQFHEFFDDIYRDWASQEDRLAEYIRILGYDAPYALHDFNSLSVVECRASMGDPMEMASILYQANAQLLLCSQDVFDIATAINHQGIANYAAERLDAHSKWAWQIGTTIGADSTTVAKLSLGKAEAESPIPADVEMFAVTQPVVASSYVDVSSTEPKKVTFSKKVEDELRSKLTSYNKSVEDGTRKLSLSTLKAVYRRGIQSAEGANKAITASARVDEFLHLSKSGSPKNPRYTQDNNLLPGGHPKSSARGMTASAFAEQELVIKLMTAEDYDTPESALVAMAEFSGLGYETIPAFRAAWKRAVEASEDPFNRAANLAINLYDSKDADLLPKQEKE